MKQRATGNVAWTEDEWTKVLSVAAQIIHNGEVTYPPTAITKASALIFKPHRRRLIKGPDSLKKHADRLAALVEQLKTGETPPGQAILPRTVLEFVDQPPPAELIHRIAASAADKIGAGETPEAALASACETPDLDAYRDRPVVQAALRDKLTELLVLRGAQSTPEAKPEPEPEPEPTAAPAAPPERRRRNHWKEDEFKAVALRMAELLVLGGYTSNVPAFNEAQRQVMAERGTPERFRRHITGFTKDTVPQVVKLLEGYKREVATRRTQQLEQDRLAAQAKATEAQAQLEPLTLAEAPAEPEPAEAPEVTTHADDPPLSGLAMIVQGFQALLLEAMESPRGQEALRRAAGHAALDALAQEQERRAPKPAIATAHYANGTTSKPRLPRVLVFGLRPEQGAPLVTEFQSSLDIRILRVEKGANEQGRIQSAIQWAEVVFFVKDAMGHGYANTAESMGVDWHVIKGGTDSMRRALNVYSIQRDAKAANRAVATGVSAPMH